MQFTAIISNLLCQPHLDITDQYLGQLYNLTEVLFCFRGKPIRQQYFEEIDFNLWKEKEKKQNDTEKKKEKAVQIVLTR